MLKTVDSLLFENNPGPMYLMDPESLRILDVNRAAIKQYGYSKKEFRNLNLKDIRPPEQIPRLLQFFNKSHPSSGNAGVWEHQSKDGRRFYVEIHNEKFTHQGRELKLVQARELSHMSREEVIRQAAQHEIHYHLENTSLGVVQWNRNIEIQYISATITEITGFTSLDLVGNRADDLIEEIVEKSDIGETREKLAELLDGSTSRNSFDVRIRTKDESLVSLRFYNSALRDKDNQLVSILSIVENLTKIEEAQQNLKEEREFIRTAVESMPGIFYMINEHQQYVMWNKNLETSLGYSDDEIRQMHPLELYRTEDHELITAKIGEAFSTGYAEVEADLFDKSGKAIRHFITGSYIEIGEKRYIIGSGIDVSERNAYEKELIQSLEEKQVLLQEIHHRVKNNLAVISGLLELQKSSLPHPHVQKALGNSQLRIKSMALIHEKLYQSRQLSRIGLNEVLTELIRLSRSALGHNNRIKMQIECDPIHLNVNQALPCTLIINELISNAYKHAFRNRDKGRIELHVKEAGGQVTISITDNGNGVADEVIRGEIETLGYTIIHTLIKQLNARLEISNKNGTHVNFSFHKDEIRGSSSTLID